MLGFYNLAAENLGCLILHHEHVKESIS